jgi:sortase A
MNNSGKTIILLVGLVAIFVLFNGSREPQVKSAETVVASDVESETIFIPSINVTAPVIYVDSLDEDDIEHGLNYGVVHLKGTAPLGTQGNSYLVGHSSNYKEAPGGYNSVFSKLPDVKIDDDIIFLNGKQSLVYKVIDLKIVESDNLTVLSQTAKRKLLTLQTSYPIGSAQMRFLVIAELK